MSYLLDTNILLRAIDSGHPMQPVAYSAVARLLAAKQALFITNQNETEFWVVPTRPQVDNGVGLNTVQADAELNNFHVSFNLAVEVPQIAVEWRRLVTIHKIIGKRVHDARLLAVMKVHGLTQLLTFTVPILSWPVPRVLSWLTQQQSEHKLKLN